MTIENVPQRDPSDGEIQAAGAALEELSREAAALGDQKDAARLHYAMGRVYGDRLGDLRSAAVCYQNAFQLDPEHRPTLDAARQLFLAAGRLDGFWALRLGSWDVAAGGLFVEEAGGRATNLMGGAPDLNAPAVVASNGRIHEAMLTVLRQTRQA